MRRRDPRNFRKLQDTRTSLRWNGTMLALASPVILLIGLGKATTTTDVLLTFLAFGIFLVGGLAACRWGRGELMFPPKPEQR